MNVRNKFFVSILLLSSVAQASYINITTKYGKTGGILGPVNTTADKVNGNTICPTNPTAGCDFSSDAGFNNNGTVNDPSDDFYTGDLVIRTNDNFEAIAGWTWSDLNGDAEERVTITGTLPLKDGKAWYEWTDLPGFCDANGSSISADRQTVTCVRTDFDKTNADTYSEDLPFQVRVLGGTPNGTQPGDITFKVESKNAPTVTDTTDNNTLTVTASPRWNIYASHFPYFYVGTDPDDDSIRGYYVSFKFRIGPDEVEGTEDNVNPALGNESMGEGATFQFTDTIEDITPNAKLLYCSMDGRNHTLDIYKGDGFFGYDEPVTYSGEGSRYNSPIYNDRHILALKGEQKITCTKSGSDINIKIENVDATLNHYPTKNYKGGMLPQSRAIASLAGMHFFIPFSDIEKGNDNTLGTSDDKKYAIKHKVTGFDPISPTGNSNFGTSNESELDNTSNFTLPYPGGWSHGWRGKEVFNSATGYVYQYPGSTWVSGDGVVSSEEEISSITALNGGDYTDYQVCNVYDAYRNEIVPINENKRYTNIGERYVSDVTAPVTIGIEDDTSNYTDGLEPGEGGHDFASLPYTVEYAAGYINDSFLPSKGGDTTISHASDIERECSDSSVKWTTDFATARAASPLGVTKVRFKLKSGYTIPLATRTYFWVNTHVRPKDLVTGVPMKNKDLIVTYGSKSINGNAWQYSKYTPNNFDVPHENQGQGDRVAYTGPKVRIKKTESKSAASLRDEITYTLATTYTVGTSTPITDEIRIADVLPKDFTYKIGSTTSADATIEEPTIGTCADVSDLETSCDDSVNQVLLWNLGEREANKEIADINYTVKIGSTPIIGTSYNKVKVETDTDISPLSQRQSSIGVNIAIPSAINIVKSVQENPDYPAPLERTTEAKDIFFRMDIQNGKEGELTDLDVIDILPFKGDAEEDAFKFMDITRKRVVATNFTGTMAFKNVSFTQADGSPSVCDFSGKIKYYYTNVAPANINIAPSVSEENDLSNPKSIWCEGDENGPNGCSVNGTSLSNKEVTAVRVRGARMEKYAICQVNMSLEVKDNLAGDIYVNSTGASATGVILPVLSNAAVAPIIGSSLGDFVWYDRNANGTQDIDEKGIAGVVVKLLDESGTAVKNPANPTEDYVVTTDATGHYKFDKLVAGNYKVAFETPSGYLVSSKNTGANTGVDSDIDNSGLTDVIALAKNTDIDTVDAGFTAPVISGHIFDDGNGDRTVNGTPISQVSGNQLFVSLLDDNGVLIASKPVEADGTYYFDGTDDVRGNKNYVVILTTALNSTTPNLPTDWNNADGEHIGTGIGLDSNVDGKIDVIVGSTDIPEVNFGINEKPLALSIVKPTQLNPGSNTQVVVSDLNISDREDGKPSIITITKLPTNGILYYNGTAVTLNTSIVNADPSKFTIDPDNGEVTEIFEYTVTDRVGVVSEPATVTMPFYDIKILGTVYNDGNANGNVDGSPISAPSAEQLYAILIDSHGKIVSSHPISSNGTYVFDGVDGVIPNSDYTVIISTNKTDTSSTLPSKWNSDGENIGLLGNDGTADSQLSVRINEKDIPLVNFAINKQPVAGDKNEPLQLNPGGDTQVNVPDLNITDNEDNKTKLVTITNLPVNGILYYDGKKVTKGQVIEDLNNSKLTFDPIDGDITASFTYTTTDRVGVVSDEATVTMHFDGLEISGNIFNDGNNDNTVNGIPISMVEGKELYVSLLDANGNVLATQRVDRDGKYLFDGTNGIVPNSEYRIVLSTEENSATPTLPTDWNNADGEHIGRGVGLDDKSDGQIAVSVGESNVDEVNFGINKRPISRDGEKSVIPNPGGDKRVNVVDLHGSDDHEIVSITIKTIPDPSVATLYYDGKPVEAGEVIENFDNALLTVDPQNGDQNVEFEYTVTDNTGWESEPATIKMAFNQVAVDPNFHITDDAQEANTTGPVTVIPVLENDNIEEGTKIYILDGNSSEIVDNNGVAVGGATVERVQTYTVEGEGTWHVENGHITFTAEDGFEGIPTPIYYVVEDQYGHETEPAKVEITTPCTCETYESSASDAVATLTPLGLLAMLLFGSLLGSLLIRKED